MKARFKEVRWSRMTAPEEFVRVEDCQKCGESTEWRAAGCYFCNSSPTTNIITIEITHQGHTSEMDLEVCAECADNSLYYKCPTCGVHRLEDDGHKCGYEEVYVSIHYVDGWTSEEWQLHSESLEESLHKVVMHEWLRRTCAQMGEHRCGDADCNFDGWTLVEKVQLDGQLYFRYRPYRGEEIEFLVTNR